MIKHSDTINCATCTTFTACKKGKHIGTETCAFVRSPLSQAGNNQITVRSIAKFIPSKSEICLVEHQKPAVYWEEAAPGKHWFVRSQIHSSKSLILFDAKKWTPEINTALCTNARTHRSETNGSIYMNVYTFLLLALICRKNSIPSNCDCCCRQQKVIQFAGESPQSSLWRGKLVPASKRGFRAWSYCSSLGLSNCKPS